MLQAMNTGHDGGMTTIHANTPRDALARLETMIAMAGMDLPLSTVRKQIVNAVDRIIQNIRLKDGTRKITQVIRIYMEEDTGKSMHNQDPRDSMIDVNRAGTPLIEVVTAPDSRSGEEAYAFVTEVRRLVRYLEICDGNMEEGSLRCDANVSIRPVGSSVFGTKVEVKNMNSISNVRRAIDHEIERQRGILESGGSVAGETRGFNALSGTTFSMRSKEMVNDYRYFPEPDLPPVVLDEEDLQRAKAALPGLPWQEYALLLEKYELSAYEAGILSEERETVLFFKALCQENAGKKALANLLINRILPWCAEMQMALTDFPLPAKVIADFVGLIDAGKVSSSIAYQRLFPALLDNPDANPEALARDLNLLQEGDEEELKPQILMIIADFPDKAMAYRKGKKGLLGFFMGELMKRTRGKADPAKATLLFQQALDEG